MYLIHLRAIPSRGAKEYETSGGAYVDVITSAASLEEAEAKAVAHIIDLHWIVEENISSLMLLPVHLSRMDSVALATYQKALLQGISAFFAGRSKVERPESEENIVYVSSIEAPVIQSKGKH